MTQATAPGKLVVTPRTLADYRAMFLLTDTDLVSGPILDCPGGGSPFGVQTRARGGSVVSVDPTYNLSRDELRERLQRDVAHATAWTAKYPDNFDWSYMGSPTALSRYFEVAAELFLSDYAPDSAHYVAAALPQLPFDDGAFQLSLCSHLLFCYPEYLTYADHLSGVLELMRVTRDEVRIYPLVATTGVLYPRLDDLRHSLAAHGIDTGIRTADCTWTAGGDQLLSCRWRT